MPLDLVLLPCPEVPTVALFCSTRCLKSESLVGDPSVTMPQYAEFFEAAFGHDLGCRCPAERPRGVSTDWNGSPKEPTAFPVPSLRGISARGGDWATRVCTPPLLSLQLSSPALLRERKLPSSL